MVDWALKTNYLPTLAQVRLDDSTVGVMRMAARPTLLAVDEMILVSDRIATRVIRINGKLRDSCVPCLCPASAEQCIY